MSVADSPVAPSGRAKARRSGGFVTDGRRRPSTTPHRRRTTGRAGRQAAGDLGRRFGQGWAMARASRSPRRATEEWSQLRLLVRSPEQTAYELLRPVVLFGQAANDRARETGAPTAPCAARRHASVGARGVLSKDVPDDRLLAYRWRLTQHLEARTDRPDRGRYAVRSKTRCRQADRPPARHGLRQRTLKIYDSKWER
jgi:hypothetical protein